MSLATMPGALEPHRDTTSFPPSHHHDSEIIPIEYTPTPFERDETITTLARSYTRQSSIHHPTSFSSAIDPFNPVPDSIYDPYSPSFSAKEWTRVMWNLHTTAPDSPPLRTGGVAFESLWVHGFGSESMYQGTVGNAPMRALGRMKGLVGAQRERKIQILHGLDGVLEAGELLVVLGPPGSGCSTFLKTLANETHGFVVGEESNVNYQGITPKQMQNQFAGEAIYSAETEQHFPSLTVSQTLEFAARARCPKHPPGGVSQGEWARMMSAVVMAVFGIGHTRDTKVGNDYVRGVSGGERKRVSIAEVALSNAPLVLWDNSTRGLDSATAISFCQTVKHSAELTGSVACVAIYQAPQAAYDVFDKVLLLYEGHQIFFGPTTTAKSFFTNLGFHCPAQQTVPDFLTGLTSPEERKVRAGFENRVPRTPEDFERVWKASEEYRVLKGELAVYDEKYPVHGEMLEKFKASRRYQQSKHIRAGSPYTLSYVGQVGLCLRRGFQRLAADPSLTAFQLFFNIVMALIVSSVFFNLQPVTSTFYSRGALLFFGILLNAFGSALEILTLYAQRPIVDKQARYAFYHPSAEAFASMATDLPYKICNAIFFNMTLYFMTNLRREPGAFFFYLLISFFLTLTMSMFFRSLAALSRTLSQALVPAAFIILALVLYTGFAIPTRYMLGWISWIRYLNPIQYGFESLMINEFDGRTFACSQAVPAGPGYPDSSTGNAVCAVSGAIPGENFVSGSQYIINTYSYVSSHKWRNFGIILAFMVGLMFLYLGASEYISEAKSKGEVKIFPRKRVPKDMERKGPEASDEESGPRSAASSSTNVAPAESAGEKGLIQKQTAVFTFEDLCYEIPVKGGSRVLLDHIDGWVKPGTLTALMGVSGAGKTTLLDVLASRVTMGVITGDILVDGNMRDDSFQRKTGYVQQQDLHLETATVRESLKFSALLRQPRHVPREEKLAYVEEILKLLGMDGYADAVVGKTGEGLNVEERKRLSIAVEMVAKPELLLFLDEPSSGLDSQTSWAILDLLETLKKSGQAILCTIHQPSAMLFSRFDRLLFLARGGRTIYFGDVGEEAKHLRSYFERNGSATFPADCNPSEYMLEIIGAAPGSHSDIDWHETWKASAEYQAVKEELQHFKANPKTVVTTGDNKAAYREFAAPLSTQLRECMIRISRQYWRTPVYIFSKTALSIIVPLFIGFSFFHADNSQQGLQNQLFSVFLLFTIFGQYVQQIMPQFIKQRESYEVRERPSRTYSWIVFMASNIMIEIPWNTLMSVIMYFCLYYPIGLYRNAIPTDAVALRGAQFFLALWAFLMFTSTFSHAIIAFMETAELGGNIANLLFSLCLIFCGVLATPAQFPGFWIFMYRVSPFTYLAEALLSSAIANTNVVCAAEEFLTFNPISGTCGEYMAPYISAASGYLLDENATTQCQFCPISDTNTFLATFTMSYGNFWRDFGIILAFCAFNIVAALGLYWLARMPKKARQKKESKKQVAVGEKGQVSKVN